MIWWRRMPATATAKGKEQPQWMDQSKAAKYVGVSIRTLQRLASEGKISRRELPGRLVQYMTRDLDRMKQLITVRRDATPVVRHGPPQGAMPVGQRLTRTDAIGHLIELIMAEASRIEAAPAAPACPTAALDLAAAAR